MANAESSMNEAHPDGPVREILASFAWMAARPDKLDSAATDEDPIEDVAMFFKNAMLWAYGCAFPLFSDLPLEIRLMIWENCIPSQTHVTSEHIYEGVVPDYRVPILAEAMKNAVVPVWPDVTDPPGTIYEEMFGCEPPANLCIQLHDRPQAHHNRHCQPAFPTAFRQKLPFIAQINNEARVVALSYVNKHVKMYHNLALVHVDMEDDIDRIDESPVWMNIKTDTVLINHKPLDPEDLPEAAVFHADDGTPYVKTNRLLGMVERNMVKTAIFPKWLKMLTPAMYYGIFRGQRVQVVVAVLEFPGMSDEEAGLTDLFGLFGEEHTALIPVDNLSLLRKLFEAHSKFGALFSVNEYWTCENDRPSLEYLLRARNFGHFANLAQEYAADHVDETRNFIASLPRGDPFSFQGRPAAAAQWMQDVYRDFRHNFEPVFLIHRCRRHVWHRLIGL